MAGSATRGGGRRSIGAVFRDSRAVRSLSITVALIILVLLIITFQSMVGRGPELLESTISRSESESTEASGVTSGGANSSGTSQPMSGVVVIQGIFDPAGRRLLELKPIRHYAYSSGPLPNQQEGRFVVTVAYVKGQVTAVPFDALVADDSGVVQHGFFEVTVPVTGKIAFIRITDAAGRTVFAHIDGSEIRR